MVVDKEGGARMTSDFTFYRNGGDVWRLKRMVLTDRDRYDFEL